MKTLDGRAKSSSQRTSTTIITDDTHKAEIAKRIKGIRMQLTLTENEYERDRLQERLANADFGGVSIIKVGAGSEVEMSEKKARIEDALFATRCAVEEGVVPGGGVPLVRLAAYLNGFPATGDEFLGVSIVQLAMAEPWGYRAIQCRAG